MISKMEELVEVIETVKDEDTATDAVEDIKAIIADLKELKEEGEELEKSMSEEEQKVLEEKFEPRLKKVKGDDGRNDACGHVALRESDPRSLSRLRYVRGRCWKRGGRSFKAYFYLLA